MDITHTCGEVTKP